MTVLAEAIFEEAGWALAAIGIALVTMSLVIGIRKKRRKTAGRVTARENLERYKNKREVRDDLEKVMVEVEELAKRVAAQLDAKTIAMEKLLDEADARIVQLQAMVEARRAARAAEAEADAALSQDGDPPAEPRETQPDATGSKAPPANNDELSKRVYELADDGLDPDEIARRLDEHIGKVELILALRSA